MKKLFFTFLLLIIIASSQSFAKGEKRGKAGGWRESYGGDATVSEFQNIAREIHAGLELAPVTNDRDYNIDLDILENKIDDTIISCGENLEIDGVKKDAINYPYKNPQQIIFDCDKWNSFTKSNKNRLVLHEFLHLMLIDDSTYEYSSSLIRKYNQQQELDKENQDRLFEAINECSINKARKILRKDINLYARDEKGQFFSDAAIVIGCPEIVSLLITEGAPFPINNILTDQSAYISLVKSIFKLSTSSISFNLSYTSLNLELYYKKLTEIDILINKKLETVKVLTQFNPEYLKLEMNPCSGDLSIINAIGFEPICTPKLSIACQSQSSPLHYLASGIDEINRKLTTTQVESIIQEFVDAGYSLDQKNSCGETPKDILDRNKNEK